MLKVRQIDLGTERYGDGYECTVTFQVGDHVYNTVKVKLIPEATREIVDNIVEHAVEMLKITTDSVPVAGEQVILPLIDESPAPEFAEVDEPTGLGPDVDTLAPTEADFIPADVLRESGSDLGDPDEFKPEETF
ncbi:hypothetical protein FHS95_000128 [Sphingomonas naasensis]|uniref:Uncharacterized protein n=1 Tax=Sphingomonas naasensis TaxID=1344951 RepID=A0A4V3QXA4_9SPHN|nr:hypothetical protein [Sphingomonas naasensis]NIJ18459.1 hypothetical protein [Sphingomonas naasensis]TGX45722.1 hypothetical protein E5A74_00630 [Sphingomonas naasensis]